MGTGELKIFAPYPTKTTVVYERGTPAHFDLNQLKLRKLLKGPVTVHFFKDKGLILLSLNDSVLRVYSL